MISDEMLDAAMVAVRPPPTACVGSTLAVELFLKSVGETHEHGGRLLGLPLFGRPTIREAMDAAKAAGHDLFFVLG